MKTPRDQMLPHATDALLYTHIKYKASLCDFMSNIIKSKPVKGEKEAA